jgi:RNA polymerase sigma-70 factor, ECF subfamily
MHSARVNLIEADSQRLFEAWYEQDMTSLYRFVWYQVRDHAATEDLTATICERAFTLLDRYDAKRGSMRAWVFGIARYEIAEYRRIVKRGPVLSTLDDEFAALDEHTEITVQQREAMRHLLRSLQNLPSREQEIIGLRFGAGFTHAEIAQMVGMTENHVAVLVHRAIKKLKQILETEGER